METGIPEMISGSFNIDNELFEVSSDQYGGTGKVGLTVLESWDLMGTANENSHKVINQNLKIVSFICNLFTISMCLYLLYNLYVSIRNSKSMSQLRKVPLLNLSVAFILCFFINTLIIVFVPFLPKGYPICDLLMQLVLLITVPYYFRHWECNLNLFIQNRYILMLQVKSASNRLTYMARVMNLASKSSIIFY